MKILINGLLLFILSSAAIAFADANDFELEYRVQRLETQVRDLQYDLRNETRTREDLERRVQYLESKPSVADIKEYNDENKK